MSAPPPRILLVEDDPDYRLLLNMQLERAGWSLRCEGSGEAGLAAAETDTPDVVLLDDDLPDLDAEEFCTRLRGVDATVPVILLSARAHGRAMRRAAEAGADDVVDKSAPPALLGLRLRAALRTRRLAFLAQARTEALEYLSAVGARLNRSLQLDEVLYEAAHALDRFSPRRLYVLLVTNESRETLQVFGAEAPNFSQMDVADVVERARAALGIHLELAELLLQHTPLTWSREAGAGLICVAPPQTPGLRCFVALSTTRSLSPEEGTLFEAFAERFATALSNALLHRHKQQANEELSEAFRALARAQADRVAAEKLAGIGQLAAGLAHEVNNPLAFVISNLNVLRQYVHELRVLLDLHERGKHDEASRMALQIDPEFLLSDLEPVLDETLEGANRVRNSVRKLRGFSQLQGGEKMSDVNLQSALESVIHLLYGDLQSRGIVLKRELEGVPRIRGDRPKLGQVFISLLSRAANAIPRGRTGNLLVRLFEVGSEVAVSFHDNGPHLDEDTLGRIFEPFEAADHIASGGFDLAIADEIVRRHGGRIEAHSAEGEGTTFTVFLPARSTVPLPVMLAQPVEEAPRGVILFIDDERYLLNAYQRAFGKRFDVICADGGEAAIAVLGEVGELDVVLCDLVMPRVDGVEVYGWVRKNRPELLDRFVIVTGGQNVERSREFLQRTGLPVIHKPFRIKELRRRLDALASPRRRSVESLEP